MEIELGNAESLFGKWINLIFFARCSNGWCKFWNASSCRRELSVKRTRVVLSLSCANSFWMKCCPFQWPWGCDARSAACQNLISSVPDMFSLPSSEAIHGHRGHHHALMRAVKDAAIVACHLLLCFCWHPFGIAKNCQAWSSHDRFHGWDVSGVREEHYMKLKLRESVHNDCEVNIM